MSAAAGGGDGAKRASRPALERPRRLRPEDPPAPLAEVIAEVLLLEHASRDEDQE
ncbi:hypothetical protein [Sorangium sp. So ce1024]|uniref:hypothetical protein n=1 Tax=Sorangium sp. So ce1024 TaxID=3133327 RepID=UPI003EFF5EC2